MAIAASIVEYACQIAATGSAAALALALGAAPDAANRTGVYSELSAGVERVSVVVGGIDGASIRRSGSDATLRLQAGTRDGIALAPRGGGTGTWLATITTAALTASRTYTLPDATGTVGLLEVAQTWQAAQAFRANGTHFFGVVATTGLTNVLADGGNSGTNGGASYFVRGNGATIAAWGNFSSILGGAYDARTTVYSASTDLLFNIGSTTVGRFDTSGNFTIGVAPTAGNGLLQLATGTTKATGIAHGDNFQFRYAAGGIEQTGPAATDIVYRVTRSTGESAILAVVAGSALIGAQTNHSLTFATNNTGQMFLGTTGILNLAGTARAIQMNSTQVLTNRRTGWTAATGTATKTTFDTATVTLPQLAERMKALIDDLMPTAGHGLIGA